MDELIEQFSFERVNKSGARFDPEKAKNSDIQQLTIDEKTFRWLLNEDAMATEKLAEGIRNFTKDLRKLEDKIAELF